jgi:MSHA biogenesis protein MshJ
MNEKLLKLQTWFESLSKREQWLTGITAVVAVVVIWHTFLYSSWVSKNSENKTQIDSLTQRINALKTGIEGMNLILQQDPDKETKDRVAVLNKQIVNLDEELRDSSSDLISPREMAHVLEDVLKQNADLTLVRLQSGQAIPLYEEGGAPDSNGKEEATASDVDAIEDLGPLAYRHPLKIEFQGSYEQGVKYLQALENLPWQFFWHGIQLETEEYPRVNIQLEVYTLSLEPGWIGG